MRKNIAVILAGGSGSRFGLDYPKQFVKLAGKTIIEHTIEIFEKHKQIDEICIVCKKEYINKIEELSIKNQFKKIKKIIAGGKERKDSSYNAILSYSDLDVNLIFHDAVRPFCSNEIITNVIKALKNYNAIDVAISASDTIIQTQNEFIKSIPNRSDLMQGQTPQAFRLQTIKQAHELANIDKDFIFTDDCGIIKKFLPDEKILVVKGDVKNIKITYQQDLLFADKIFQLNTQNISSENSCLEKLEDKVIMIFGGSSGIGKEISTLAKFYKANVKVFSRSTTNTNIANINDVKKAFLDTYNEFGKIDYVVNSAAILIKSALNHTDFEDVKTIIDTNYLGAINICKIAYEYLYKTKGSILNFTSSSYTRGRSNYALYSSSKAAIVNLTQALSEEYILDNIKINCINPQRTLTPMRIRAFGKEDPATLLDAKHVAKISLDTLISELTGLIVDIGVKNA